ncbi:universal stress protein [Georgenia satyanarayanai]|uniref:universal stress protein n=1 Tax=Georgenia satyanarayanai TaxID=860221 RepID=UPI0012653954|nr:universal stress protein [Georgenia satyanarayanai]
MAQDGAGVVVVGVDGSEKDDRAVDWAADEAAATAGRLHILHSFSFLFEGLGVGPEIDVHDLGSDLIGGYRERVRQRYPQLAVTTEVLLEDPAVALVRASRGASTVVVGARGLGRVSGRLLGSVSQKVAAHARGVVVVVRDTAAAPEGPVVIGVDPGHTDPRVLEFGFTQASRRETAVRLVHARPTRIRRLTDPRLQREIAGAAEQQAMALAQLAEDWAIRFPDVPVDVEEIARHPVEALTAQSADACLLVVGSRARSRLPGLHLGSVARGVLVECPVVAVVRVTPPP